MKKMYLEELYLIESEEWYADFFLNYSDYRGGRRVYVFDADEYDKKENTIDYSENDE